MTQQHTDRQHVDQQHVDQFAHWFNQLHGNVSAVIRGKRDQVAMALVCLLAEGHLLLEDKPGTGKTSLAKCIANSIGGEWKRIQFTPDLLPSDVTGGQVYRQGSDSFKFVEGPVFAHVVLADEINRASPKAQAALLEVMEERQVTTGVKTRPVPRPFVVIATQNPVEHSGTYPLPEAQLDRFLMSLELGYPDRQAEIEVLRSVSTATDADHVGALLTPEGVSAMIDVATRVSIDDSVRGYIVDLMDRTRDHPMLDLGVSTRGCVAMVKCARVLAAVQGNPYVRVDEVRTLAHPVMKHRMMLKPEARLKGVTADQIVDELLDRVPVPATRRVGV